MPNNETYEKIAEWLESYHSTKSVSKKAKLKTLIVSQMIPVVKHIARTIARRSTDPIEDMIQAGFVGLLKAIDRYNKEKNDNFKVYAGYLIIGEMKHFLRDKLNTIRVPGYIQELSVRIHNFTKDLTNEELEQLTIQDVAAALHTTQRTIDITLQVERRKNTVSIEDFPSWNDDNTLCYEEIISADDYKEKAEEEDAKIIFEDLINKLPPEEKVIIDMYYKQDMSQKQIAEALQTSQMAINRKMKSAFNIIAKITNGAIATIIRPVAKPSKPSVRLTALLSAANIK